MIPADTHSEYPEAPARYTLEILARLTGLSTEVILQYQEHGIICPGGEGGECFDDETVRTLRRLDHLRHECEMNYAGVRVVASLLAEVERLRRELAARR